jgi:site-specific DNA recombinase
MVKKRKEEEEQKKEETRRSAAEKCVIYARVSTKEQQEEGFSIPAQVKAIRALCAEENVLPVEEFVEAESAGKPGRKEFGRMLAYLREHPEVRLVVAHKLDRMYRNFEDYVTLESELGVRVRYVQDDAPDTPLGQLIRGIQLSMARFYRDNLAQEVTKGMNEKAAQGGWPSGKAPIGYLNDRNTRGIVVDRLRAPLVVYAFERYSTGMVSVKDLARELEERGLRQLRYGTRVHHTSVHGMLRNPVYCGLIRYKEELFEGRHEPLISLELFEKVQAVFEPNRNGHKERHHVFALRDFLWCGDCGCKITAELQRGHTYYRCSHGKGREVCAQRVYTREERLQGQLESILASIELPEDIIQALVEESRLLDEEEARGESSAREVLRQAIAENREKTDRLLDGYLEKLIDKETYQRKAQELSLERIGLERRLAELGSVQADKTARAEALLRTAATARMSFAGATVQQQREVLSTVLLNARVCDQEIVDYQLKSPFNLMQMDSNGALVTEKWAILDLNQ